MRTDIITSFTREHRFLSNFSRVLIQLDSRIYPTVEHAYQAAKIDPLAPNYADLRRLIRNAPTPGRAKRLGGYIPLRKDWPDEKLNIMRTLVTQKFNIPTLTKKLIATAPATIVERNSWGDRYWGICEGRGENHLGRILMNVREQLIHEA